MADYQSRTSDSHRSLITVSGLLGGFSFSGVISLLRVANSTLSFRIAFISFLLAAFFFLATMFGGWATVEWILSEENYRYEHAIFYKATVPLFIGALVAFAVGVSATAFFYSVFSGIVASCAAAGLLIYVCISTISLALANTSTSLAKK